MHRGVPEEARRVCVLVRRRRGWNDEKKEPYSILTIVFPHSEQLSFEKKNEGCPLRKSRCWLLRVKAPREQEMGKDPEGKRWDTQHLTLELLKV